MKNVISSSILIVGGLVFFFVFGGPNSDYGIIGVVCIIVGILGFFFPKINENFLKIKSNNNFYAIILFLIILIPSIIYIWYKSHN